MKDYFIASICRNGILGGAVVADDKGISYKTGKLTVPSELRDLRMEYRDIRDYSEKWVLCFPIFTIAMKNGETYKFIIFSPGRFRSLLFEKLGR